MATMDEMLETTCRVITEKRLGVKFTPKQFRAYCRRLRELHEQQEINQAIALLEEAGYTVTPPSPE
jgi:hypothetical protein